MSEPIPFTDELLPWHKRQATLLYHYASLEYLKGLLPRIDALIARADALLNNRSNVDASMLRDGWDMRDTAANWGTGCYPALLDFRASVLRDISLRAVEEYDITGANNASRMLSEYSMNWATPEQEEEFRRFAEEEVFKYATPINMAMRRPYTDNFLSFLVDWEGYAAEHDRIPKFRIRRDIEGITGKIPPRTGVYMPQDDPNGTLQFAWTGGGYGDLGDTNTYSPLGLEMLRQIGRHALWFDAEAMFRFATQPQYRGVFKGFDGEDLKVPSEARYALSHDAFEYKACKWYYVELLNDQYEAHDGTYTGATEVRTAWEAAREPSRPAGSLCPRSGYWSTPAQPGSLRKFREGDVFPAPGSTQYGAVLWQFEGEGAK